MFTQRLNKTNTDATLMHGDDNHKNLGNVLPYVTYTCNIAVQEKTIFTPSELMRGHEVTTMLNAMLLPNEVHEDFADVTKCARIAKAIQDLA